MDATLHPFSLPLARPLETAAGTVDERAGLQVRLEADGHVGWGEATPLAGWTECLEACRSALEAALAPLGAGDVDPSLGDLDDSPAARHGLHLALADLESRRRGVPLHRWLGDEGAVESVPVNATVGDGDVPETVDAVERAVADGFGCVKVKVGSRPVDEDVERLEAARDIVGPGVALRADANGAWTRGEARAALDALADVDLDYVEQPLPAADLEGLAGLRSGPVEVAADESLGSHRPEDVISTGAADVLVLKPMVLGGLDRAREAAVAARAAGLGAVVSTTVDAVVARTGTVHLAASLPDPRPAGLATAAWLETDVGEDPAPIADGRATVPDGPGLGVAVDPPD